MGQDNKEGQKVLGLGLALPPFSENRKHALDQVLHSRLPGLGPPESTLMVQKVSYHI